MREKGGSETPKSLSTFSSTLVKIQLELIYFIGICRNNTVTLIVIKWLLTILLPPPRTSNLWQLTSSTLKGYLRSNNLPHKNEFKRQNIEVMKYSHPERRVTQVYVSVTWSSTMMHFKTWKTHVQCHIYHTEISYWGQIQIQQEKPTFVTVTFLWDCVRGKKYLAKIN